MASFNCNKTFTLNNFNDFFTSIHSNLKVFHLNIVSLNKNASEFAVFIESLKIKFDIIILSEIRDINLAAYNNLFPNYDFLYNTPINSKAGGIGIFISNHIDYHQRYDLSITNNCETLFIEIKGKGQNMILRGIYRHTSYKQFFSRAFQKY